MRKSALQSLFNFHVLQTSLVFFLIDHWEANIDFICGSDCSGMSQVTAGKTGLLASNYVFCVLCRLTLSLTWQPVLLLTAWMKSGTVHLILNFASMNPVQDLNSLYTFYIHGLAKFFCIAEGVQTPWLKLCSI